MNLSEPQALRAFLDRHGLSAKKGLGQHFLCSKSVVEAIRKAVEGHASALEIGPGPGILTGMLCDTCGVVTAIELDSRMPVALAESAPCATILEQDALKADLSAILRDMPEPRALVSNLPYYITGPLLTRIAENRAHFGRAVLMMQREVARRVVASEGSSERGSLSVFLQSQFQIKKVADAPAGAFLPPPKVDSAVLSFDPIPTGLAPELEQAFFKLVRIGFVQPRKTLVNNLLAGYGKPRETVQDWLGKLGWDERIRPQQLSNDQWKQLIEVVTKGDD